LTQISEVFQKFIPVSFKGVEKPYPGRDGIITSNESDALPPYFSG